MLIRLFNMLKIEVTGKREGQVTVRLQGQLVGPWVDEVRRACAPYLGNDHGLTLDFFGVSFVDRDGVAFCQSLRHGGATFTNCSPFVKEQIYA